MNNSDADWIKGNIEKPVIEMPEAPGSIHIDSYLDGFHVGWTKRLTDPKIGKELFNIKAFVKQLQDEGFMPSWNQQTNDSIAPKVPASLGNCKNCGSANKWSTKTNKAYCGAICWKK